LTHPELKHLAKGRESSKPNYLYISYEYIFIMGFKVIFNLLPRLKENNHGGDNMPAGDGTGPAGQGSMTGRGAGYCAGYNAPGYANTVPRMGIGFGRGRGFGRGMGFNRGFGWRRTGFAPFAPVPPAAPVAPIAPVQPVQQYQPAQPTKEQEIQMLENETKAIEQEQQDLNKELEAMKKRIEELKSKN
jgi:hypothetical protein